MTRNSTLSLHDPFNITPLLNDFIGFDNLFTKIEYSVNNAENITYPPYDIYTKTVVYEKGKNSSTEEHTFIEFAVAGITKDRLCVEMTPEHVLTVKTIPLDPKQKAENIKSCNKKYIRKGIADREFIIHKTISENLELVSCKMKDGMLIIEFRNKDKEEEQTAIIEIE